MKSRNNFSRRSRNLVQVTLFTFQPLTNIHLSPIHKHSKQYFFKKPHTRKILSVHYFGGQLPPCCPSELPPSLHHKTSSIPILYVPIPPALCLSMQAFVPSVHLLPCQKLFETTPTQNLVASKIQSVQASCFPEKSG